MTATSFGVCFKQKNDELIRYVLQLEYTISAPVIPMLFQQKKNFLFQILSKNLYLQKWAKICSDTEKLCYLM
jgi:hypothetical protein